MVAADKQNMEIAKVLGLCREIEFVCAELYKYYAELFNSHPEMSALWRKTAVEEENHTKQFDLAISLLGKNVVGTVCLDGFMVKNLLNYIQSIYAGVKINKPSMLEALRSAIKIEEKLKICHVTTAVNFAEESHQQLFSAMMLADKKHIEDLQAFHRRLLAA